MRTIIINTLGSELRKNPLFYLPFQAEQFHWIEKDLQQVDSCAQEIAVYQSEQGQRQDYHLILLLSLAQLPSAELSNMRQVYEDMLTAYLNDHLLDSLCQDQKLPPVGVSLVYMLQERLDGEGNVEAGKELDRIFGFQEYQKELPPLVLKNRNGDAVVDFSVFFQDAASAYACNLKEQNDGKTITQDHALLKLREDMKSHIKSRQRCLYIPTGMDERVALNSQVIEFAPRTTEWDLCCVDLQINLCEHLQAYLDSTQIWKLELQPHDPKELHQRIQLAVARVRHLRNNAPRLNFFTLEADEVKQQNITGDIWEKLRSKGDLPGVEKAFSDAEQQAEAREAALNAERDSLAKELKHAWLLIGREKKRFEKWYANLQADFEPGAAQKQQRAILDICADTFAEWRRKLLSRKTGLPAQAKETELPVFERASFEEEVSRAQQDWGEAAVAQLEDYTDVRQEAEQIKADFRKAYRLWPDGEFNTTSKFFVYSAVLAVLFLLQMLLPYMTITMGQPGFEISRFVHLLLSLLLFAGLYLVGLLIWMRALCKQLKGYTEKMYWLWQESNFRRRKSIVRAVESYGEVLPRCALCYERLLQLQQIHEENLQRKERYNSHAKLLAKAEELLHELCSLLRMSDSATSIGVDVNGGINFELAPSHPENMPYYVFLSEKWGRF